MEHSTYMYDYVDAPILFMDDLEERLHHCTI
jgi:hypothetical protein